MTSDGSPETTATAGTSLTAPSPRRVQGVLSLLAIGTFAVGADGMVLNGLLASLARSLSVSVTSAGQLVTAFAVTYAVAAPGLALLIGRADRRYVLAVGAGVFTAATLLQAVAPTMTWMVPARVLAAAGAALYVSNATASAGALVAPERQGRALALVYGGFTVATVAAGPVGLVVAGAVGWRPVLAAIAVVGALAAGAPVLLPPVRLPAAGIRERVSVLVRPAVLTTLAVTVLAQAATMGAQVYLPVLLSPTAGTLLPVLLAVLGVGAVVGTWLSGRLVDRVGPQPTRRVALTAVTLVLAVGLPATTGHRIGLLIAMPLFGLAAGMVLVPQQHRLLAAAPAATAVVLGWGSSSIYLGAAIGSVIGGAVLAGPGPAWFGPVVALPAVLALLATSKSPTHTPPSQATSRSHEPRYQQHTQEDQNGTL